MSTSRLWARSSSSRRSADASSGVPRNESSTQERISGSGCSRDTRPDKRVMLSMFSPWRVAIVPRPSRWRARRSRPIRVMMWRGWPWAATQRSYSKTPIGVKRACRFHSWALKRTSFTTGWDADSADRSISMPSASVSWMTAWPMSRIRTPWRARIADKSRVIPGRSGPVRLIRMISDMLSGSADARYARGSSRMK